MEMEVKHPALEKSLCTMRLVAPAWELLHKQVMVIPGRITDGETFCELRGSCSMEAMVPLQLQHSQLCLHQLRCFIMEPSESPYS